MNNYIENSGQGVTEQMLRKVDLGLKRSLEIVREFQLINKSLLTIGKNNIQLINWKYKNKRIISSFNFSESEKSRIWDLEETIEEKEDIYPEEEIIRINEIDTENYKYCHQDILQQMVRNNNSSHRIGNKFTLLNKHSEHPSIFCFKNKQFSSFLNHNQKNNFRKKYSKMKFTSQFDHISLLAISVLINRIFLIEYFH